MVRSTLSTIYSSFTSLKKNGCIIPVLYKDKKVAQLRLITSKVLENRQEIRLLSTWRKKYEHYFPTQFYVTDKKTRVWLEEMVLNKKDRLLFFVEDEKGESILGHMGLYRGSLSPLAFEIDNVARGDNMVHDGVMTYALLTLMQWALNKYHLEDLTLQTFADNTRAIALYKRCGFNTTKKIPVKKVKKGTIFQWVPVTGESQKYQRELCIMSHRHKANALRIALLANNFVGFEIARYLKKEGENIVFLGAHEKKRQKHTQEIIAEVEAPYVVFADKLHSKKTLTLLKKLKPDILIAAFWGYILKKDLIEIPEMGCINFHPGYLPYNRGMNPNVWPFIESTPAGVTIHFIDSGVDTGDIIAQRIIPITPFETAGTLEKKTWAEIVNVFKKTWPKIKSQKIRRKKQNEKLKTSHKAIDIGSLDFIDPQKKYSGQELIQRLRARSYSDHTYAFTRINGKKVYVNITLSPSPKTLRQ